MTSMDKLLYNKDVLVARIDSLNHFTWVNKPLAPLYLQNSENFLGWLENRCIDTHRPNSRLLRRALRLEALEDSDLALEVNAATITDTYWVKDADSPLKWYDVQFKKAEYSSLALIGGYDNFQKAATSSNKKTQELTNSGSFEKCWRVRDGSWWLYKQATSNQLFSELFAYKLGQELGFNMAEYRAGSRYIKQGIRYICSKDFTEGTKYNFEPIVAITGTDVTDYIKTYSKLKQLDSSIASDYVSILFLDTLLYNPDRHCYNFGLLTDPDTGEILRLAPNFDNNMALISDNYPSSCIRKNDILIDDFNALLDSGAVWNGYSDTYTLPIITDSLIRKIIRDIGIKVKENFIADFIMTSYNLIGWNKKMAVNDIIRYIHGTEYIQLLDSKKCTPDQEAIQNIPDEVFYISPNLKVLSQDKNPKILIFSAAGATGKSALAHYLAHEFKCPYWDLSLTPVGDSTFYGRLDKRIGRRNVDSFHSKLSNGETALIIDAFDEAEIRRGRSDIELFLDDIIDFSDGLNVPSIILLSRSENARFLQDYLSRNSVPLAHYEIGIIDEANGKEFIRQLLQIKGKVITPTVNDAIDKEFEDITSYLKDAARDFLGYPPVLEALTAVLMQESNTLKLIQGLKRGTKSDKIFERIMKSLLIREQQKVVNQIKPLWNESSPEFHDWSSLYNCDEQIFDILSYVWFSDLYGDVSSPSIPDNLHNQYSKAIETFLPSHPFIKEVSASQYYFSGPAFRDYSIIYGLISPNTDLQDMARSCLEKLDRSSPLLAEFFSTMNPKRRIKSQDLPYIYDSFKASEKNNQHTALSIVSDGTSCICLMIRFNDNEKKAVKHIECWISFEDDNNPVLYLPSFENSVIFFPGKIIAGGRKLSNSAEVSLKNCIINCNEIEFKTKSILVKDFSPYGTILYSTNPILISDDCTINALTNDSFKICAPETNKNYKIRQYSFDPSSIKAGGLDYFSHLVSVICGQFRKNTTCNKLLINKLFRGDKESKKFRAFDFLLYTNCIVESGSNYTLNLDQLSELGIKWSGGAQREASQFPEAFKKYQEWINTSVLPKEV